MQEVALRVALCILFLLGIAATVAYFEFSNQVDVAKTWFFWSAGMFTYIVICFVILKICVGDGDDTYRRPLLFHVTHGALFESEKREHSFEQ